MKSSPPPFARSTPLWRSALRQVFPSGRPANPSVAASSWSLVETLVLCLGALAISAWFLPDDPFGLRTQFPWLWMMPALLAMRYGTAVGVAAIVTFVLSWLLWPVWQTGALQDTSGFPKEFFLGGVVLTLVCGQFSDVWTARSRRLRAVNAYLDERLKTLTNNHFLLRLSHERLERDLLAKPLTLRETLTKLRSLTMDAPEGSDALPGGSEFLQLLGQSCQLEVAALYEFDTGACAIPSPVASLGDITPLDSSDPLFVHARTEMQLTHVQTEQLDASAPVSRYLICAPVVTSSGTLLGMVAIEKLPFFTLNDDTLQLMTVLAGYYADGIQMGESARSVLEVLPACPPEMALDLVRLHRIYRSAGIDSSLVALVFNHDADAQDIYEQVKRLKRGVDLAWELKGSRHRALITLLPLAGAAAVEGYLLRLEQTLRAQFGIALPFAKVATLRAQLGPISPAETVFQLVQRCDL